MIQADQWDRHWGQHKKCLPHELSRTGLVCSDAATRMFGVCVWGACLALSHKRIYIYRGVGVITRPHSQSNPHPFLVTPNEIIIKKKKKPNQFPSDLVVLQEQTPQIMVWSSFLFGCPGWWSRWQHNLICSRNILLSYHQFGYWRVIGRRVYMVRVSVHEWKRFSLPWQLVLLDYFLILYPFVTSGDDIYLITCHFLTIHYTAGARVRDYLLYLFILLSSSYSGFQFTMLLNSQQLKTFSNHYCCRIRPPITHSYPP